MSGVQRQRRLGAISAPPSAYTEDVEFAEVDGIAELSYRFERHGVMHSGGILFRQVRAYRYQAEAYCTEWHVSAYNNLVVVDNSEWVEELRNGDRRDIDWGIQHYLIFIDDAGAFEIAATGYVWLSSQPPFGEGG